MVGSLLKQVTKSYKEFFHFSQIYVKNIDRNSLRQNYHDLFLFISLYLTIFENIVGFLNIPFLTVAPAPYILEPSKKKFTLVLDLDETLAHFTQLQAGGHFQIRPYALNFLKEMSHYYEIIIFTAGMPDYANWVIDNLDKDKHVSYRLFRHHACRSGNVFLKDLSRIGRELSKIIIIDNI